MKTIRKLMSTDVVWISPSARAKTAVVLMKGHNIGALPVMQPEDDHVVGIVTQLGLLGAPPDAPVTELMEPSFVVVDPDTTITDAADRMNRARACCLIVVEEERLVGIVTRSDLMPELGKNFDPLTGLPWSDSLRDWAMQALKRGVEISVVFFDLDGFGLYNKVHGHVVGDAVLKEVAQVLKTGADPESDLACRYGGDEFVLVSSRNREDVAALAESLKSRIGEIRIPDVPEGVSGTYGMFGGRRTKEREDIHYAATIDDLITRASKNCIAAKPGREEPEAPTPRPGAQEPPAVARPVERLRINTVTISTTETSVTAEVTLALGSREFKSETSGHASGAGASLRLVAEAAAEAVGQSLPPGTNVVVESVTTHQVGTEDEIVSVATNLFGPRLNVRHIGSAFVRRGDPHRAAVAAMLSSVNRVLESPEN